MPSATFSINGETVSISRNQDQTATINPEFAKTSRACPPFCVHPMSAGDGIETVSEAVGRGEIAVSEEMQTTEGTVDARVLLQTLVRQSLENGG